MHQQPLHAPLWPNNSSNAGHNSGVSGRILSFLENLFQRASLSSMPRRFAKRLECAGLPVLFPADGSFCSAGRLL
jgi:hypothetical protein